jgi:hypothetical protein
MTLAGWAALALLPFAAAADEVAPTFKTIVSKKGDECKAEVGKDGLVCAITSKSGIGKVAIILDSGKWPRKLTFQLLNLRSLEQLILSSGGGAIKTRMPRDKTKVELFYDADRRLIDDRKKAAYTLTIEKKKDLIEVVLTTPAKAGEVKSWEIDWIDAFR